MLLNEVTTLRKSFFSQTSIPFCLINNKQRMPSGWSALKTSASQDSSVFGGDPSDAGCENRSAAGRGDLSRSSSRNEEDTASSSQYGKNTSITGVSPSRVESYVVTGAPPPSGQGAPRTPNEFLNVAVGTTRKNADATGKEVVWYDITVRTTTHQWLVSKRFSDFAQVHDTLRKLRLNQYFSEIQRPVGSSTTALKNGGESGRRGSESARSTSSHAVDSPSVVDNDGRSYRHPDFPPPFPSRYHLRSNMDATLVENRRVQLDIYWKGVLRFLQSLTLAAIGVKKPYSAVLRSAFAVMVDFLRYSSQTECLTDTGLWVKDDDPYHHPTKPNSLSPASGAGGSGVSPVRGGGASVTAFGSPLTASSKLIFGGNEVEQQPPCKMVLEPRTRFTIIFFLPGVLLGDIYVDATSDRDRSVVIGGKWNTNITGLESLKEQGVFQHSALVSSSGGGQSVDSGNGMLSNSGANGHDDGNGGGASVSARQSGRRRGGGGVCVSSRGRHERSVLMDSLPRGDFEMIFDVPAPFERAHWYSEYEGGVLLIMWDAPTTGGASA